MKRDSLNGLGSLVLIAVASITTVSCTEDDPAVDGGTADSATPRDGGASRTCEQLCGKLFECVFPFYGSVDECVVACDMDAADALAQSATCGATLGDFNTCLAGLACADFRTHLERAGGAFACRVEEDEFTAACFGDRPATEQHLCADSCAKTGFCTAADRIEKFNCTQSCINKFRTTESLDGEACRSAFQGTRECIIGLSCPGFNDWSEENGDPYPCNAEDDEVRSLCVESRDLIGYR